MNLVKGFLDHKRRRRTPWQFSLQVVADVREMDAKPPKKQLFWVIERFAAWCIRHLPCEHKATDDHCGIPEHRHCAWCFEPMPNAPIERR